MGSLQVLLGCGVGDLLRIKAFPFVLDLQENMFSVNLEAKLDAFGWVVPVTVLD